MSPSSELIAAENPEIFGLTGSDSLLQLVLELYRFIWSPFVYILLVVSAVTIVHHIESREIEQVEGKENKRWTTLFSKLQRISKAIQPKEAAPKQEDKKKVNRKPSPNASWFHSFSFNLSI